MRFTFTHLPAQVQSDLTHIAKFLVEETKVTDKSPYDRYTPSRIRHIMLHGCFTEDHWTAETVLRPDEVSYRYNIMVIVSAHLCDILPILERAIAQLNQSGELSFPVVAEIIDTKGRIDKKLRNGYLAYDQIQTRGVLIYSRGDITRDLFTPLDQPDAEKHYLQAKDYFDQSYPLAQLFLSGARSFKGKDHCATAFMLTLSAEQTYTTFMVVHILKYPSGRPLWELRELAESIHPELSMVWSGLREEQNFYLLARAFRDVRFSANYSITDSDLNLMFGYVEDLHKLVRHICQIKFDALKAGSLAKPNKDWLEIVAQALRPDADDEPEVPQTTIPFPSPNSRTAEQEEALEKLSTAISGIEGPCSELHTIADILRSLSELNSNMACSCEFYLMAQFLQERIKVIEGLYGQMIHIFEELQPRDDMPAKRDAVTS